MTQSERRSWAAAPAPVRVVVAVLAAIAVLVPAASSFAAAGAYRYGGSALVLLIMVALSVTAAAAALARSLLRGSARASLVVVLCAFAILLRMRIDSVGALLLMAVPGSLLLLLTPQAIRWCQVDRDQ